MRTRICSLRNLAPMGPNAFRLVVAGTTKQLNSELLFDFGCPVASRLNSSLFTIRTPRIRPHLS
jgi:hypothetical protein